MLAIELEVGNSTTTASLDQRPHVCVPVEDEHGPEDCVLYRTPSSLTMPDLHLQRVVVESIGRQVGEHDPGDTASVAYALCRRVHLEMQYAVGTTTVRTTASEAWAMRRGVCQDYAHALLALCRLAGFPARYVSGYVASPGAQAMHAWVEVFASGLTELDSSIKTKSGWLALDPTHGCWTDKRYIAVAVGCDYADIKPTSGVFVGNGRASLLHRSWVSVGARPDHR